ncbi:MAG: hypothetical protein ACYC5Q_08805 [Thermoleophilia bacterium]
MSAFEIEDDNLTRDRDRAAAIFEGFVRLREGGTDLTWRPPNGVRVDSLDDEMVGLMVRSGCTELFYMIGYPGEDRRSFETGLEYLRRIRHLGGAVTVSPNLAQPYPGTRLLSRCRADGWRIDPAFERPLDRPSVMSTRRVIGITGPDLDIMEILRRRELVLRLFGPRWKSTAKRIIPGRVLPYLSSIRPLGRAQRIWRDL